ncbi:CarD family transcriptional regulator [Lederbergia citri]|uniref:CarD family transcriptional regulator n=1 Tax=Lederbergia citri TaxID=2833580 RepID=A0A942TJR7_9BACI|nr:CarD family transcriptional regulator [Lederbergia citri]MBS4197922.1 CarD family transcriptional regulator [Lederbergia citri]
MFNIGDLVVYSAHGICKIDDICERTVLGITRPYYVLHPIENNSELTISTPVNNDKVVMQEIIDKEEAINILESFKHTGIQWIDKPNMRYSTYSDIINTGDRKEIANIVNTLMRKEIGLKLHERKLYVQDRKILNSSRNILFKELAISLDSSFEEIDEWVTKVIKGIN